MHSLTNVGNLKGEKGGIYISDTSAHAGEFDSIQGLTAAVAALVSSNITGTLTAVSIPAGSIIFGNFSSITLASGSVMAYNKSP